MNAFQTPGPVKICTLNVRGLNSKRKQYRVLRLVLEEQPDVFAVQETKMTNDVDIELCLKPFLQTYEVCVSHAVGVSAGCFLFVRKSLPLSNMSLISDTHGRFIVCDFDLSGLSWRFICVYAPNIVNDRDVFFRGLRTYLECDKVIVLLGDFNCVCEQVDRSRASVFADKSVRQLSEMLENNYLCDVGRFSPNNNQLRFTHFQASSHARMTESTFQTCS